MSAPPALAAESDDSEALGQVINADLLGLDLLDTGTSLTGNPSDPGPNANPLDVGLIEDSVSLDLGSLQLPLIGAEDGVGLLHLGEAGALSSYATSPDAMTSTASAGAVGEGGALDLDGISNGEYGSANVELTQLLGQLGVDGLTDEIVDEISLQLGAVGSTAEANGTEVDSSYVLADGQLQISSPLVGGLSSELDTALTDVGDVLDGAVGADGALGTITDGLEIDADLGVAAVTAGGGTIGLTGVDAALDEASTSLLAEPLVDSNGLVSIDLVNGTIAVDLQALGGLNDLPANTELLDSETIGLITGAVTEALGTLTTKVGEILVDDVFNNVGVSVEIPAELQVALLSANVDILVDTTLGQLAGTADGEPTIDIDGNLLGIPLGTLLTPLEPVIEGVLITPLQGVVGGVIDTATTGLTDTLDAVIQPVLDTLSPILSEVLTQIVSVTINEQLAPGELGAESFTVNAVTLQLLPTILEGDSAVAVSLASSSVRASEEAAQEPTLAVDPESVNDGDSTTVTGQNYPPNTDVSVQLQDSEGNAIGDPVVATTDDNGEFTANLPVPEGTTAGDYLVEGVAESGESAVADLAVTNGDDPTDDNTADNTADNESDNTADNADENTADNTADNESDNTAENESDNTADNADVNTADNTDVNTTDNTADNATDNESDNTADNADENTADNTTDNESDNTADNDSDNTADNESDNTADNADVNTADNTDVNTTDNTADNATDNESDNTADNADENTADNTTDNESDNTADNESDNTADNTEVNTTDNTADNTGENTSDNTADNTARAEIDLTPDRAVQDVDDVLVIGTGYTPNGTADVHLRSADAELLGSEEPAGQEFSTLGAVADPGEQVVGTVAVDENGEVSFRLPSSGYETGDYVVTVVDTADPELADSSPFTVVSADEAAEDPAVTVDPTTVETGDSTTVTGENFAPETDVDVQLTDPDGNPVGDPVTVTTDEDGEFTTEITVPADAVPGSHEVVATDASGNSTSAPLLVTDGTPVISADPSSVEDGGTTTVTGADFAPETDVEVQLTDQNDEPIGEPVTATTDENGTFTADLPVPEGAAPGDYEIVASDADGGEATAPLEVTVGIEDPVLAAEPGSVPAGDSTTVTGADYPGNTDVELQLFDGNGEPVGDPVMVTTDENGAFTSEVTILEGTAAGDYSIVGTATSGESATAPLAVTAADDSDNGDDNGADNGADNVGDNGTDNTGDSTGDNGADNTGDSTGDNGADNTGDSTGDNGADNAGDSTGDNGADNTGDSTGDNTGDSAPGLSNGGSAGGSNGASGGPSGGSGSLAQTGAAGTAAMIGLAALLVLAGGAGLAVSRRSAR